MRAILAGSTLLLYVLACSLPALRLQNGDVWPGAQLLALGAFGILLGQMAWLANPVAAGILLAIGLGSRRWIVALSLIAVLIGLLMMRLPGMEIPLDEGGVKKTHAAALEFGAWVWLTALAAPGIASLFVQEIDPDVTPIGL